MSALTLRLAGLGAIALLAFTNPVSAADQSPII
jgi:hypothetical protein